MTGKKLPLVIAIAAFAVAALLLIALFTNKTQSPDTPEPDGAADNHEPGAIADPDSLTADIHGNPDARAETKEPVIARLNGYLTDNYTGKGVHGILIRIYADSDRDKMVAETVTSRSGNFGCKLPVGDYIAVLSVLRPSYDNSGYLLEGRTFPIIVGAPNEKGFSRAKIEVERSYHESHMCKFTVVDATTRKPLGGVDYDISGTDENGVKVFIEGLTDIYGRAEMQLVPGEYIVVCGRKGSSTSSQYSYGMSGTELTFRRDRGYSGTFYLRRMSRIEVTVLDAKTGEPIEGATVYYAGISQNRTTDSKGRFSGNTWQGSAVISVRAEGYTTHENTAKKTVEIGPETATVEFRLEPRGAYIHVRVFDLAANGYIENPARMGEVFINVISASPEDVGAKYRHADDPRIITRDKWVRIARPPTLRAKKGWLTWPLTSGKYFVRLCGKGCRAWISDLIDIGYGEEIELQAELRKEDRPPVRLSGRIIDSTTGEAVKPIEDTQVTLVKLETHPEKPGRYIRARDAYFSGRASVNSDGTYEAAAVPGTYSLEVYYAGMRGYDSILRGYLDFVKIVELHSGSVTLDVKLIKNPVEVTRYSVVCLDAKTGGVPQGGRFSLFWNGKYYYSDYLDGRGWAYFYAPEGEVTVYIWSPMDRTAAEPFTFYSSGVSTPRSSPRPARPGGVKLYPIEKR